MLVTERPEHLDGGQRLGRPALQHLERAAQNPESHRLGEPGAPGVPRDEPGVERVAGPDRVDWIHRG